VLLVKGPRWGILMLGGLVVVLLFTFPLWRSFVRSGSSQRPFANASDAQRELLLKEKDRDLAATVYAALSVTVPAPTGEPTAPSLDAILSGSFIEIDAIHRAQGSAQLYRLSNSGSGSEGTSIILRLEDDFAVTNAPELFVYLSGNPAPVTIADLPTQVASPFEVGVLKGSSGEQQFSIPSGLRLDRYRSVVIVSRALNRIYSYAVLN
jgi:hypothetical protein